MAPNGFAGRSDRARATPRSQNAQDDALRRRQRFEIGDLCATQRVGRMGGASSLGRRAGWGPRPQLIFESTDISAAAHVCWPSSLSS